MALLIMIPSFFPHQIVDGANQYFTNGMSFYLCGVSYINSDQYYDLTVSKDGEVTGFE